VEDIAMCIPLRELNICGVFVTPASVLLLVCLIPSIIFHYLFAALRIDHVFWNPPLVEVVMFFIFFAAAVLALTPC
jgi:hypothetical protein